MHNLVFIVKTKYVQKTKIGKKSDSFNNFDNNL